MVIDQHSQHSINNTSNGIQEVLIGSLPENSNSLLEQKTLDKNVYRIGFHLCSSFIFLIVAARLISPFFNAILFASVLAIVGMPLKTKLDSWKFGPNLSSFLTTSFIVLLMFAPVSLFTFDAVDSGHSYWVDGESDMLGKDNAEAKLRQSFETVKSMASPYLPESVVESLNWKNAVDYARTAAKTIFDAVVSFASSLPDTILNIFFAILILFFLLRDGSLLVDWFGDRIPLSAESWMKLKNTTYETTLGASVGSFWAAFAQSSIMAVAFLSLSIPGTVIAVGTTFFLAWIPFVGSAPVWIVGLIYLAIQGFWLKFAALCAFAVVISLADNVVRVLVVSKDVSMHPIVSLLAIIGGIEVFGFVGVIIGPAFVALSLDYFNLFKENKPRFMLF